MTEFIPPATRWFPLPSPFPMKRGGALHGARLAYETWGTLDAGATNAVLVLTGMSPDAHAASSAADPSPGWWEWMIGPGKPIDTDRWFVVCVNALGSCKGSTGPASPDPATGEPYRLGFPELSIEDGADAAAALVRGLGIRQLACVVGNSMGGMTALALLARHPGIARGHVNICGAARALPFSIAIRSLQREAIRLDPQWNGGDYEINGCYPENGMRMARKLGVITYRWNGMAASAVSAWIRSAARTTTRLAWSSKWRAIWRRMRAVSSIASTPTAISTSAARWTGSTSARRTAATPGVDWLRCRT